MNTFILCCFGISVLLGVYLLFQTVNAVAKNAHENSSSYKNTSYDQLSESYDGVKHLLRLAKANDKLAYSKLVNSNNPKIMNFLLTFIKEKNTSNADGELIYFTRPLFYQIGDMAIEPLFEIFLNDEVNRRSAAIALAFFGDKIVPRLLENINKHPYEVVITIVQMDKAIGNPVLISLLNHNDGYVSAQAASFLRSREVTVPQEMIDSLIVTYRNQEPTKLGGDLALTLYYLMGNKAFQIYKETYQSPNPYKRASIIRVVEERRENLNDASVLEFIYTSLVDSSSIVRQSALVAISKFPCRLEQIFPMLWKIYQEGDPVEMEYAWKSFYLSPDNPSIDTIIDIILSDTDRSQKALLNLNVYFSNTSEAAGQKLIVAKAIAGHSRADQVVDYIVKYLPQLIAVYDWRPRESVKLRFDLVELIRMIFRSKNFSQRNKEKILSLAELLIYVEEKEEEYDDFEYEYLGHTRVSTEKYKREIPHYLSEFLG